MIKAEVQWLSDGPFDIQEGGGFRHFCKKILVCFPTAAKKKCLQQSEKQKSLFSFSNSNDNPK